MEKKEYKIEIDPRILELLGPNLYTNIYYVLAELIANAYDADAHNVYIISEEDSIRVEDDGHGMSYKKGGIAKYLGVAKLSRTDENDSVTDLGRKKMGRKGIGKLAALSVSENVDILTIAEGEKSGFVLSRHPDDDGLLQPINDIEKVQFENTFFNMTQTFEHLIEGLSIEHKVVGHSVNKDDFLANAYAQVTSQIGNNNTESNEIKGRALFKYLYQERKIDGKQLVESIKKTGIKAFENVMDGILDHYFRYFYRILKFIDDTELIDNQQKYYYASIFRAQLSKYELLMLYFNGLSKFGREKLKPLMEKYCILKNLDKADLPFPAKDMDEKERNLILNGYEQSASIHHLIYEGNYVSIIINSICYSIVLIILLALSASCLDNFIFKDILSLPILNDNSGKIVCLILTFMILYGLQIFFDNKKIDVKKIAYTNKWDSFRYVLSNYYNAYEIQLVFPLVASLFYLCGMHSWYGYGFILYVNLVIIWLFIKPLMGVMFTVYKLYQFK